MLLRIVALSRSSLASLGSEQSKVATIYVNAIPKCMRRIQKCYFFFLFCHLFSLLRSSVAIGYGLSNSSFALALNSYFRVRLNRASGVAMTLAGIGPILYPPLIQYLLINYDVNGCMLIIGAIALHMLIAAVLLQPIKWHLIDPSNLDDVEAKDAKLCDFMSKCSLCQPAPVRGITTCQSIGKFSNASCK